MSISRLGTGVSWSCEPAPRAVVAVPAKDEAERLPACLSALDKQIDERGRPLPSGTFGVVFFVNNSRDDSAEIIRRASLHMSVEVRVVEAKLPCELSHAGGARRMAMDLAAAWLGERSACEGVLLTTDADSRVAPDWICANLKAFAQGAEVVLGQISLDEEGDRLSAALHVRGKLEAVYEGLLNELSVRLDPQDCNPWPHHSTISGASLALTRALYRRVGGLPLVPLGEDKALVAELRRCDARIRFAPEAKVVTSGRTSGRAPGGVADTLLLRNKNPTAPCDETLERCATAYRRALWRGRLSRAGLANAHRWRERLRVPAAIARRAAAASTFGEAWELIEQASPELARRPLAPAELPRQIEAATRLLRRLQALAPGNKDVQTVLVPPIAAADFNEIA